MKRPLELQNDYTQVGTVGNLMSIFEAIASIHIGQIKDKVQSSTAYFNELWGIYRQLRLDRDEDDSRLSIQRTKRSAVVAITSDTGLSGDIDERVIVTMLKAATSEEIDMFILGQHGSALLRQKTLRRHKTFTLPDMERGDSIQYLARLLGEYQHATVFYQTYVSLTKQDIASIDLFSAVQTLGEGSQEGELISSESYILEPSAKEIIRYMESIMVGIALGQLILESKLAHYASRFNTMYAAKTKAGELRTELGLQLNRAKRAVSDERTKEILSSRKVIQLHHSGYKT